MAFSLGTIWVQVVPSFKGVQEAAATEARKGAASMQAANEQMLRNTERAAGLSGKRAGKNYGSAFEREMKPLIDEVDRLTKNVMKRGTGPGGREFSEWRKMAAEMKKVDLSTAASRQNVFEQFQRMRTGVRDLLQGSSKLNADTRRNASALLQTLDKTQATIDGWRGPTQVEKDLQRASAAAERERKAGEAHQRAMARAQRMAQEENFQRSKRERETEVEHVREMAKWLRRRTSALNDAVIGRDLSPEEAQASRSNLLSARRLFNEEAAKVRFDVDEADLVEDLNDAVTKAVNANKERVLKFNADLDTQRVRARLAETRALIESTRLDMEVDVDFDREGARARIAAQIQALEATLPDLDVQARADTTKAVRDLHRLEAQLRDVKREAGLAARAMAALDAGSAANSVRVFNGILTTTLALGPALIPVLATLSAGLVGGGVAAMTGFAGVGILVAGLAGIGGAVKALNDLQRARRLQEPQAGTESGADPRQAVQDARSVADAQRALARAREDAADSVAAANRRVRDAEVGLADAHKAAADAAVDARRRVADAERNLADAQKDTVRAQQDINAARAQAVRDLEDLNASLRSATLGERGAEFALEEANAHLNVVLEDDQATDREKAKAQLAYEQAKAQLEDQRRSVARLTEDVKEANAAGIEGSDRVISAKERALDAAEREAAAERSLADARKAANDTIVENARRIQDAERQVSDARKAATDARVDAAQRITDAERSLSRAYEDITLRQQKAATATNELQTELDALEKAMDGLSPAGQRFARFLFSLKPLLDDVRTAAQNGLLPGLENAIRTIVEKYGPGFVKFVGDMSKVLGDLAEDSAKMFTNPFWESFFDTMAEFGPEFLQLLGEISLNLLTVFAGISKAFAPFTKDMLTWLNDLTAGWAKWAEGLANSPAFGQFMAYLEESAPKIGQLFTDLLTALLNLMIGLAPYADKLVDVLLKVADWLASMDPDEIAKLALNIGAIVLAIQVAAGFTALISSTAMLLSNIVGIGTAVSALGGLFSGLATTIGTALTTAGGWVSGFGGAVASAAGSITASGLIITGIIAAAVAAIWWLWNNSDQFREGWENNFKRISNAVKFAWDNVIFPVVDLISTALSTLWNDYLVPLGQFWDKVFRTIIAPTVTWLWESIIKPYFTFIMGILETLWGVIDTVFTMATNIIKAVFAPVFNTVLKPAIEDAKGFIEDFGDVSKAVFGTLGDFMENEVAPQWNTFIETLGDAWSGLLDLLRLPIRLFLEYVINDGLIGGFNWLADRIPGLDKVDPVPIPQGLLPGGGKKKDTTSGRRGGQSTKYAAGGVLPGYTPGRDVFRFFNPSVGTLDLSGGEAILVPELTRAIGADRILAANAAARSGSPGRGAATLGGFKGGGILDWAGDAFGAVTSTVGKAAGWVGDKIGDVASFLKNPRKALESLVNTGLSKVGIDASFLRDVLRGVGMAPIDALAKFITGESSDGGFSGGGGEFGSGPAMGWQSLWDIVRSQFPNARLNSAYRPGAITAVGTPSLHGLGRAIDISPSMDIFNWIAKSYPNSTELIYSPAGPRQLSRGRQWNYGEPTKSMHYNHVHWAMKEGGVVPTLYDNGGDVPPGLSVIANKTGRPEVTLTNEFVSDMREKMNRNDAPLVDARGAFFGPDASEIAEQLRHQARNAQALAGLDALGSVV